MANININFKYLCSNCHRGKEGPHMSKEVDLKYKKELQDKLFYIFNEKEFFTESEIKQKLDISSSEFRRICKGITRHKEGYVREDIISKCMGGNLYLEDWEKEINALIKDISLVY